MAAAAAVKAYRLVLFIHGLQTRPAVWEPAINPAGEPDHTWNKSSRFTARRACASATAVLWPQPGCHRGRSLRTVEALKDYFIVALISPLSLEDSVKNLIAQGKVPPT